MENRNDMEDANGCARSDKDEDCGCTTGRKNMHGCMPSWHCRGRHHLLKYLIGLLILLFVFWAGVKIGELKSALRYGWYYGGAMMREGSGDSRTASSTQK